MAKRERTTEELVRVSHEATRAAHHGTDARYDGIRAVYNLGRADAEERSYDEADLESCVELLDQRISFVGGEPYGFRMALRALLHKLGYRHASSATAGSAGAPTGNEGTGAPKGAASTTPAQPVVASGPDSVTDPRVRNLLGLPSVVIEEDRSDDDEPANRRPLHIPGGRDEFQAEVVRLLGRQNVLLENVITGLGMLAENQGRMNASDLAVAYGEDAFEKLTKGTP